MEDGDRQLLSYIAEFRLLTIAQLERLTGRRTLWRRLRVNPPSPLIETTQVFFKKPRNRNLPFVFSNRPIDRRSEDRLDHELLITEIHIALHRTGYLSFWQQGKDAWQDRIHQDAFAILHTESGKLHLFIEADTGTENHQQLATKLRTYHAHADKPFRLLFVTGTESRARNLARLAEHVIPAQEGMYYLFTYADALAQTPLAPICLMPHQSKPEPILPD